jgi:hypothetical protein
LEKATASNFMRIELKETINDIYVIIIANVPFKFKFGLLSLVAVFGIFYYSWLLLACIPLLMVDFICSKYSLFGAFVLAVKKRKLKFDYKLISNNELIGALL